MMDVFGCSFGSACMSSAVSSGDKALQLIYSPFDPIRPASTSVSTALGNVCIVVLADVLQIERKRERGGSEVANTGGFQGH